MQDMALVQVEGHLPYRGPFSISCKVPLQGPHRFQIFSINPSLVSSANLDTLLERPKFRSLIYMTKRRGPKTDPWGTPLLSAVLSEGTLFTMTLFLIPANQFSIQTATLPWMLRARTFIMNLLWGSLSKVLRKFKKTTSTTLERSHSQNT